MKLIVLSALEWRQEETKGRQKEKARRRKGIWFTLFITNNTNPWVQGPPLHPTVKEFNNILITSLTFRRWKPGKSYCVLLLMNLRNPRFWKGKLCRRCSPLPGNVGSQLLCWHHWDTSTSEELPRQQCPEIPGTHFSTQYGWASAQTAECARPASAP